MEFEHMPGCAWERTTTAECEYRATHHYCPHPEHACTCPPRTKPLNQHLSERMNTANNVLGFLLAASRDGGETGLQACVQTLIEIAVEREVAGTLYVDPIAPAEPEGEYVTKKHREEARELMCGPRTEGKSAWLLKGDLVDLHARIASALSARDAEIREVLEGLVVSVIDSENCWCPDPFSAGEELHDVHCLAARELYEKLQPAKESSDG